jgi:hypothetical protein
MIRLGHRLFSWILLRHCLCGSIRWGRHLLRFNPLGALSSRFNPLGASSFLVQSVGGTVFAVRSWRVHNVAQEEPPEECVGGNARTH